MTTKSSGFSLIELLVVIAIIGILSATATMMYSSYSASAKTTSAKNIMLQVSLGQTEYLSSYGSYYYNETGGADCEPSDSGGSGLTSNNIETNLFQGGDVITDESGYDMCIQLADGDTGYMIKATNHLSIDEDEGKKDNYITLDHTGTWGNKKE